MTPDPYLAHLRGTLDRIRADGFYKTERVIRTPQMPALTLAGGAAVVNFCANNYLGLADDPELVAAAKNGLDRYGYGMASVRFICGTQSVHRELEAALASFLDTGDAILYSSCFDANGGLFETLLGEEDAVISDELNHASIVDGIRLCKARRYRYRNNDMADLDARFAGGGCRRRALQADRDRRRVLDGRHRRRPPVDLRPRGHAWRARDGRRFACGRLRRRARARHAGALRRARPHRHPDRDARQSAGRRVGRVHGGRARKSSTCCASARVRTSSRIRSRRALPRPRSRC